MKKIAFIILAATLILMGCSKNDDFPEGNNDDLQLKSADSRTVNSRTTGYGEMPLICEGEEIEPIEGPFDSHWVDHYKNCELQWTIYSSRGTVTSSSGENFIVQDAGKFDKSKKGPYMWHSNARGDQGTHLILSGIVTFTVIDEDVVYDIDWEKAMCVPDK